MDKVASKKVKAYCMEVARKSKLFSNLSSVRAAQIQHDCWLVDEVTGEILGERWMSIREMTELIFDGSQIIYRVKPDSKPRITKLSHDVQEPDWIVVFKLLTDKEIEDIEKHWNNK